MREFPAGEKYRAYTLANWRNIPEIAAFSEEERQAMEAVAQVFPFRVSSYVVNELIDWERAPNDPMFQLTFPQPNMLSGEDLTQILDLQRQGASAEQVREVAAQIRARLNPHPGGQTQYNVPVEGGERLEGVQHKYAETLLFFPKQGQTCHSYCAYCFRWAQFIGAPDLQFAGGDAQRLARYVKAHPEIESVLLTGGDPMVMSARLLERYIAPLLEIDHVQSIRIGTKFLSFWPRRVVSDKDAGQVLDLFRRVRQSGRHLAVMTHLNHPVELSTPIVEEAIAAISDTGATLRAQAPMIRHVNDDATALAELWRREVRLGVVPYYQFVERDTGSRRHFELPLNRALEIFTEAYQQVSGLARTVRGPVMSCDPGKIMVEGVAEVDREKVFVLKFLQARKASWVNRPFFAHFDPEATWIDELRPAFSEPEFFYESELRQMRTPPLQSRLNVLQGPPPAE